MSLNLNAALSSFIAASPRLIHHSKTLHWKKKKITSSTDLSRDQNTICVWTQYSSCSSSAGRLVYGPTNTWMGHICFYLFIYFYFALRHRPLSLPQSPPHQCCAGAGSGKVTPSHLAKFVMRVTVMSHSFLTVVCKLVSVRNHSHVAKWQQKIFLPTMAYSGQTRNSNGNKFLANIQKASYISNLICPNETPPFPQPITGKW